MRISDPKTTLIFNVPAFEMKYGLYETSMFDEVLVILNVLIVI